MVKVCQQYFQDGLNQQEIAKKYGMSRSQVSRMISAAKAEGIVEITIRNPFSDESALEKEMIERFSLRDAIVVDVTDLDDMMAETLVAQAGAAFFESIVKSGDTIGVMAGKSIAALVREFKDPQKKDLHYIPLVGGWGSEGLDWHANTNAQIAAKNTKGSYSVLHSPAVVTSAETKETLLREPEISSILKSYTELDAALVGIGEISKDATHVISTNMKEEELQALEKEGAIASLGTIFIDRIGQALPTAFSERMIGISGSDLKKVPVVIAAARGSLKVESIHAALAGGWTDVLVTDMDTAKAIISKSKSK